MAKIRTQHVETETLRRGIERCLAHVTPFSGTICRAVGVKYANRRDLLTGEGAKRHGARWNPPGRFCAVYGTLDPYAALAETIGTYGSYSIPFEQRMPLVLVGIEVVLRRVLDLSEGKIRQHLGVSQERMLEDDWKSAQTNGTEGLTQAIGRLAWEVGLEAIVVSSARFKQERNLVAFPDHVKRPSFLKIVNRRHLPELR